MLPGPSRRATRAAGIIKPEGVRALAVADDIILLKVYELFSPAPAPHAFLRIIQSPTEGELAIFNNCAFDAPLDAVRDDPSKFVSELERICSKVWEKAGLEVDSVRLNNLVADWRTTCYGSSTRLAFNEQHGLYIVARKELKKGIVNGANAVIVGIERSRVSETGIEARSRHLDWEGTFSPLVGVWFGPMRLVTSGCEKCRNVGYETFSTHGVGEIGPPRTVHQPLAVLKRPIPEGEQMWGKAPTSEKQCACPVPTVKHKLKQTAQTPVIRLKVPKRPSSSSPGGPSAKRLCAPSVSSLRVQGAQSSAGSNNSSDGSDTESSTRSSIIGRTPRRRPRPRLRVRETETPDIDSPASRNPDTQGLQGPTFRESTASARDRDRGPSAQLDDTLSTQVEGGRDLEVSISVGDGEENMQVEGELSAETQTDSMIVDTDLVDADKMLPPKRISILQVGEGGRVVSVRTPSLSPPPKPSTSTSSRLFWAKVSTPLPPPAPRIREQWSPPPHSAAREEPVSIMQPLLRRWPIMFDGPDLPTQQRTSALHDLGLVNAMTLVHAASALETTGGNIRDAIRLVEPKVDNEWLLDEDPLPVLHAKLSAEIMTLRVIVKDKEEGLRRAEEAQKQREGVELQLEDAHRKSSSAQAAEITALKAEVTTLKSQLDNERRELDRLKAHRGKPANSVRSLQAKVADLQSRLASAALSTQDQLKKARDAIQLKDQRIHTLTQYQQQQEQKITIMGNKIESLELAAARVSNLAGGHAEEVRALKAEWKRSAEKAAARAEKAEAENTRLRELDSGTKTQIARAEEEGRLKMEAFKVELRKALSDEWARKTDNETALEKEVERLRAENARLQALEEQWETMRTYIQNVPSRPSALPPQPDPQLSPPILTPMSLPDTVEQRAPHYRDEEEQAPKNDLIQPKTSTGPVITNAAGSSSEADPRPQASVYSPSRPVLHEAANMPTRRHAPREDETRGHRVPRADEARGHQTWAYGERHREDYRRRSDVGGWRNDGRIPRNGQTWRNSSESWNRQYEDRARDRRWP